MRNLRTDMHPIGAREGAHPLPLRRISAFFLGSLLVGLVGIAGCGGDKKGGGGSGTGPDDFDVTVNLTVQGAGNGNGQVSGSQINCQIQGGQASATGCQGTVTLNSSNLPTTLTLTASPSQGSTFVAWTGSCAAAGAGAACQLSVNSSTRTWTFNSTAQFDLLPGTIEVTTVTGGSDLDSDGYSVAIGQANMGVIGIADVQTYSGLIAGDHAVTLGGMADNCTVDGNNPRTLTVASGGTTQTTFNVTCVPTTGSIEVTTVTSGNAEDLDDGYTVTMDQEAPVTIGINTTETYAQLTPGNHTVTLGDLADNCTLDDGENPRTLAVVVGQTTSTTFNLTCSPPPGAIEVTTITTGENLPDDEYTVSIDQGFGSSIGINATVTISLLTPGDHEVGLGSVPANCSVAGDNPRSVTVVAGATAQTTFNVSCVQTNLIAFERVSERGDKDICLLDPNVGEASVNCITGYAGDTADDVHPAWGPKQEWLIFASDRDGDFELYTMKVNGSDVTQITDNDVFDGDPDLYFTGLKAVFTSERSGNKDIWEMDLSQPGNPVTQLTTHGASDFNPTFTYDHPTMRLFTSTRVGDQDIWRVDGPGNVSQQTIGGHNDDDVAWLPPNLYYSSDLYGTWDVIRSPTGLPIEDFFPGNSTEMHPAPGPDGLWVALVSNRDGNFEIYKKNWSTGEFERLTDNGTADTRPAWWAWWP